MSSSYDVFFFFFTKHFFSLFHIYRLSTYSLTIKNKLANLNVGSFVGSQSYTTKAENITIQSHLNEDVTRLSSCGFIFVSARVAAFI